MQRVRDNGETVVWTLEKVGIMWHIDDPDLSQGFWDIHEFEYDEEGIETNFAEMDMEFEEDNEE